MPAFTATLNKNAKLREGSFGSPQSRGRLRFLLLLAALCPETSTLAQSTAPKIGVTVAYVSEVPWQWNAGQGNPLEMWARKLSAEWAPEAGEGEERLRNLLPELSWQRLAITARNNAAEAFVVNGYEWIESGAAARLDVLLAPSWEGKTAMAEFVILRQRAPRTSGEKPKFSMDELFEKQILVDRGGCGELVYRWLDREIRVGTGATRREDHAEFRSAANPTQAVLSVYFGEAEACIVSRSSYLEVQRTNPNGLLAKLEEVRKSPPLLKHVIACPHGMTTKRRAEIVKSAAALRLQQPDGLWSLAVPSPDEFKDLRLLIADWQKYFGDSPERFPAGTPIPAPVPAVQKDTPTLALPERRIP